MLALFAFKLPKTGMISRSLGSEFGFYTTFSESFFPTNGQASDYLYCAALAMKTEQTELQQAGEKLISQMRRFATVSPEKEQQMLRYFDLVTYPKRSMLLEPGALSKHEYYVVKGCLRLYLADPKGNEHTLTLCVEDWWSGDLGSWTRARPATYTIQALEETTVFQITRENFERMLRELPELEKWFRLGFQNAVVSLHDRTISHISATAEQRYLEFAEKYPSILQRVPQKHIASYLGITPEFLSMLRKKIVTS